MKTLKIGTVVLITILFVQAGCHTLKSKAPTASLEAEKEAIRKVIELETESYYKQDFETWKSTYVNESYFRSYGYWEGYTEKVKVYNGFESLKEIKKKQFEENRTLWQGSVEEKSNENFRIYENVAWYTFDQLSYSKASLKLLGKSVETRILEKHNGKWKIAYLSFHYLPMEEKAEAVSAEKN